MSSVRISKFADAAQDALAKAWGAYLATRPLGVSFFGDSSIVNSTLINSLLQLQMRAQSQGKNISIVSGQKIVNSPEAFKKALEDKPKEEPKPSQPTPTGPQPKPEEQKEDKEAEKAKKEAPKLPKDQVTLTWKKYLKGKGLYGGDENDPKIDDAFGTAVASLEKQLSSIIPTTRGMIWQGNQVNPQVTPQEFEEALKMAQEFKKKETDKSKTAFRKNVALIKRAFPTLDALGPPDYEEKQSMPTARPSRDDTDYSYSPEESNHNGVAVNKMPKKQESDEDPEEQFEKPTTNIDDRMEKLVELMTKIEKR